VAPEILLVETDSRRRSPRLFSDERVSSLPHDLSSSLRPRNVPDGTVIGKMMDYQELAFSDLGEGGGGDECDKLISTLDESRLGQC